MWGLRILMAVGWLALAGCAASQSPEPPVSQRPAPPAYSVIAASYNARVERLSSLWARTEIGVSFLDDEGKRRREQGEGHLQYRRSQRLALTLNKLGNTYFYLGGDGERYWWFDLRDDGIAWVGRVADLTPQTAREVIGPVHPLDLIELLGVTALPEVRPEAGVGPPVGFPGWDESGRLIELTLPVRWGYERLLIDPQRMEPTLIELYDRDLEQVCSARLLAYQPIRIRGDSEPPRVPTRIEIDVPRSGASIRLHLHDAQVRSIPDRPFDFEALVSALGVREVRRIEPAPSADADGP